MDGELETIRAAMKALVLRVLEANSVRELLKDDTFQSVKSDVPDIINALRANFERNAHRFDNQDVDPMDVKLLDRFRVFLSTCSSAELLHLAEVSTFIMERETHAITKKIIETQR